MVDYYNYAINITGSTLKERLALFKIIGANKIQLHSALLSKYIYKSNWYAVPPSVNKYKDFSSSGDNRGLPTLHYKEILNSRSVKW